MHGPVFVKSPGRPLSMGAVNVTGPGFHPGHFCICIRNLLGAASDSAVIKNAWASLHKRCPCAVFRSALLVLYTGGRVGRRVTFRAGIEQGLGATGAGAPFRSSF